MIWEENWPLKKKPHFKHDIWPQRDSFALWKVCKLCNRDTGMEETEGKKLGISFHSSGGRLAAWLLGGKTLQWNSSLSTGATLAPGPSNCFLPLAFRSGGDAGTLLADSVFVALCWLSLWLWGVGLLFVVVCGLLVAGASLIAEHSLQAPGLRELQQADSVAVGYRLRRATSCGIFLD